MPKKLKKSKGKAKGKSKGKAKGKKGKAKSKKGKKGRYWRLYSKQYRPDQLYAISKSDGPTKEALLKESLATAKLWEARYNAVEASRKEYREVRNYSNRLERHLFCIWQFHLYTRVLLVDDKSTWSSASHFIYYDIVDIWTDKNVLIFKEYWEKISCSRVLENAIVCLLLIHCFGLICWNY